MAEYLERHWGFSLQLSEQWVFESRKGSYWFFPHRNAAEEGTVEIPDGHLLIRPDWVFENQNVAALWQQHVGKMAGAIGAKKVGAARLNIRNASGYEAEIVLPKKENKRLWLALLVQGPVVLNLVVGHHLKDREWFEPEVSSLIASLRFVSQVEGVLHGRAQIPLPDGYSPVDPRQIVSDIQDSTRWQAYRGRASIGALQAFYLREARNLGWQIGGYTPYPSTESHIGFARFELKKGETGCTLGILPSSQDVEEPLQAADLVIKWN